LLRFIRARGKKVLIFGELFYIKTLGNKARERFLANTRYSLYVVGSRYSEPAIG